MDEVLAAEMTEWSARGLERVLRAAWQRTGVDVDTLAGRAIDFSSNDYLGLATHPELVARLIAAVQTDGVGATASRLIAGNHPLHEALERDIAAFFGAPAALSFSTGFAANVGTIPALVGPEDVIFADAFNHASLIDGCRLSRATTHVYPHSDMTALRALLGAHRGAGRRALIISDGLFSMDGDVAHIGDIVALAREFGAWTYIDDAHAVGALGDHGRGTAEMLGVSGVDVTVGTLGKAFGVAGAFVHGSAILCRHLMNRARSFVYSTAMLPAQAGAASAALAIVAREPARRVRLRENARAVRFALTAAGVRTSGEPDAHIVPVFVGDAAETMRLGAALRARGILVGAVRPPTVAHGSARLRISVSAGHTAGHIAELGNAIAAELVSTASA